MAPDRDVVVTRHQQGFPDSRPSGPSPHLLPPSSGLAAPGLSRELRTRTGQEPVTHVTAGTGRTQTRSYVPGISQTSSRNSLTACDLVSQSRPTPAGCAAGTSEPRACSSSPARLRPGAKRSSGSARNCPACTGPCPAPPASWPCAARTPAAGGKKSGHNRTTRQARPDPASDNGTHSDDPGQHRLPASHLHSCLTPQVVRAGRACRRPPLSLAACDHAWS